MIFFAALLLLQPADSVPAIKPVSFDELIRAVKAHRGKVVVVDFWDDG